MNIVNNSWDGYQKLTTVAKSVGGPRNYKFLLRLEGAVVSIAAVLGVQKALRVLDERDRKRAQEQDQEQDES